jgi:hypothetical protein
MDEKRKQWNKRQKVLRTLLDQKPPSSEALDLFFEQHAEMHSGKIEGNTDWSLEDQILDDLHDEGFREIPSRHEHSIAWLLWHIARIEDVTMSMLVAGKAQLFKEGDWREKLGINFLHTGNAMSADEIHTLSQTIDLPGIRDYRVEVGRRTIDTISRIELEDLVKSVDPERIQAVAKSGAVVESAYGILDYWSKRTIAGLLLMPATRHNLIHLNEAERIKTALNR